MENADELQCAHCGSQRRVGWYGFLDWKNDNLWTIGVLCRDCWVIVYDEGKISE